MDGFVLCGSMGQQTGSRSGYNSTGFLMVCFNLIFPFLLPFRRKGSKATQTKCAANC